MDKKKQYAIIGVLAGLILTAVIVLAVMNSGGGSDSPSDNPPAQQAGGGPSGGRRQPPTPASDQADRGIMKPTPSSAGRDPFAAGGKTPKVAILPGRRQDPFYYKVNDKILPPPPNIFDSGIEPIRVASATQEAPRKPGNSVVRVVPNRRVSGIMSGPDGVYAIIENTDGTVEIVKPGSRTKDGYTVVSITDASVLLRQEDTRTHTIYTQLVMFTDAPVSSTAGGGNGGNGGGSNGSGTGNGGGNGGSPGGGRPGGGGRDRGDG